MLGGELHVVQDEEIAACVQRFGVKVHLDRTWAASLGVVHDHAVVATLVIFIGQDHILALFELNELGEGAVVL